MILRPYIYNPHGINNITAPIFTSHMVSIIFRPYIHNTYGINDIKALYSQPICINDIKALYSQPIWYQ